MRHLDHRIPHPGMAGRNFRAPRPLRYNKVPLRIAAAMLK